MSGTTTIDGSSVSGPWLQIDIGQSVVVDNLLYILIMSINVLKRLSSI